MATYRIDIEYDGTRYRGWQEQKNARSVAGELRVAVEDAAGQMAEIAGSGRTDAGVHALAQVARLRFKHRIDPEPFRRAVNDRLPADIHVLAVRPVADAFHARHDAVARAYVYQISRRRTGLAKRHVWWIKAPLDLERMRAAAARLAGRHDFTQFCERPAEQSSTVVVVDRVQVEEAGALILVRVVASHFLWKMVRRIVGVLVRVGLGEVGVEDVAALATGRPLPEGRGTPAGWTAPSAGLFLERVVYPGEPPLGPLQPAVPVASEPPPAPRDPTAAQPRPLARAAQGRAARRGGDPRPRRATRADDSRGQTRMVRPSPGERRELGPALSDRRRVESADQRRTSRSGPTRGQKDAREPSGRSPRQKGGLREPPEPGPSRPRGSDRRAARPPARKGRAAGGKRTGGPTRRWDDDRTGARPPERRRPPAKADRKREGGGRNRRGDGAAPGNGRRSASRSRSPREDKSGSSPAQSERGPRPPRGRRR